MRLNFDVPLRRFLGSILFGYSPLLLLFVSPIKLSGSIPFMIE
jgi:hypothetical protein